VNITPHSAACLLHCNALFCILFDLTKVSFSCKLSPHLGYFLSNRDGDTENGSQLAVRALLNVFPHNQACVPLPPHNSTIHGLAHIPGNLDELIHWQWKSLSHPLVKIGRLRVSLQIQQSRLGNSEFPFNSSLSKEEMVGHQAEMYRLHKLHACSLTTLYV
jgi:hypothetical protein